MDNPSVYIEEPTTIKILTAKTPLRYRMPIIRMYFYRKRNKELQKIFKSKKVNIVIETIDVIS